MLSSFTATKLLSHKTPFILLAYLTCCVWAYPAASSSLMNRNSYRVNSDNNYNGNAKYYGYNLSPYSSSNFDNEEFEYQPQGSYNEWDRAIDPPAQQQTYVDDELTNDYWSDLEAYANQLYGEDPTAVFGQTVYQPEPESELEALKAEERRKEEEERELQQQKLMFQDFQQLPSTLDDPYSRYYYESIPNLYSHQNKRDSLMPKHFKQNQVMQQHASSDAPHNAATTPQSTHETSTSSKTIATTVTTPTSTAGRKPIHVQPGQKEIPMLRPPNKPKASSETHPDEVEDDEPIIQVAQRSSSADKPSAYDTLRKYLSLEDALKNEAEKRRASAKSRLQKRAPGAAAPKNKQIVSDLESLTGQLHNLKKSSV